MNRGRIQAQGRSCQKSESWAQVSVPSKNEGMNKSSSLQQQLNRRELQDREQSFAKLEKFIRHAPVDGYDECTRSFTPIPPQEDVRVDVEIIKGRAFRDDQQH